MFSDKR